MDEKLFKLIEIVFIGGALIVVIYLGGFFGPVESLGPIGTPQPRPINLTEAAKQATTVAVPVEEQFPALKIVPTASSPPRPKPTPTLISGLAEYQIVAGDTCWAIADKFKVTLDSLITLNGLDAECRILAGSTLKIPQPPTDSP